MEDLKQKLEAILTSERSFVKEMEPMSRHTTFRIGGPAALYAAPGNEAELAALLRLCRERDVPVRIRGRLRLGDEERGHLCPGDGPGGRNPYPG